MKRKQRNKILSKLEKLLRSVKNDGEIEININNSELEIRFTPPGDSS